MTEIAICTGEKRLIDRGNVLSHGVLYTMWECPECGEFGVGLPDFAHSEFRRMRIEQNDNFQKCIDDMSTRVVDDKVAVQVCLRRCYG